MANDVPNEPAPSPAPEPSRLFQAIGNPIRWDVMRRLAMDGPQSVNDLAAREDRGQDSMSRHLTLLWKAGAVIAVASPDGDARKQFYAIPPERLRSAAGGKEIDYGACVLRFA